MAFGFQPGAIIKVLETPSRVEMNANSRRL
jgi:hypothetical protein